MPKKQSPPDCFSRRAYFRVTEVPNSLVSKVLRGVSLNVLAGHSGLYSFGKTSGATADWSLQQHSQIQHRQSQLARITTLRHCRVRSLRSNGWPALEREVRFLYALNCRPAGLTVSPTLQECGLSSWCPYCWARHVAQPLYWQLINMRIDQGHRKVLPYRVCLEVEQLRPSASLVRKVSLEGVLRLLVERRAQQRRRLASAAGSLVRVELGRDTTGWHATCRYLSLYSPEAGLPDPPAALWKTSRCRRFVFSAESLPTRKIAALVVRVLKYNGWLWTGRAASVVDYLNARQGVRLTTRSGVLRGSEFN